MVTIFERSKQQRKLRYVIYCGNQDSSTMKRIRESSPYSVEVVKKDCVCHIERKMGRNLRAIREKFRNQKLSDGKFLTGRGRLTDAVILSIQRFYGRAIRDNQQSVNQMRDATFKPKALMAIVCARKALTVCASSNVHSVLMMRRTLIIVGLAYLHLVCKHVNRYLNRYRQTRC